MSAERIVIAGGPRTGKTTLGCALAAQMGVALLSTDDLIGKLGWSEASEMVSTWLDDPGSWVVEGVATVRAIRKWLRRVEGPVPFCTWWLDQPVVEQTAGQAAMHKGCETVWLEVLPELLRRQAETVGSIFGQMSMFAPPGDTA